MPSLDTAAFGLALDQLAPKASMDERTLILADRRALQALLDHLQAIGDSGADPVFFSAPLRADDVVRAR